MECPLNLLHCPYCGSQDIDEAVDKELITCRACGASEEMPSLKLIQLEDRLARAISGYSIQACKAKAQSLATVFHRRWRTAMCYLNPASSAAISHAHDLMIHGMAEEDALPRAKVARVMLQRLLDDDPALAPAPQLDEPTFLDDWF
jgi:hypothetical protein